MKRFLLIILLVMSLVLIPKNAYAESKKVTIYFFRGQTCEHCEEALNYINEHKDEIDSNIEIKTYEVWKNSNNSKLQEKVAEKLGVDTTSKDYGVPFIVIGTEHIIGYGGVSTYNNIMSIAKSYIDNKDYQDVVEEASKELNLKFEMLGLNDLFYEPSKVVSIVVFSIFGLIIIGFIGMIVFSRK